MKLTALFLLACVAMADEAKPKPIGEVAALRLENLSLRLDLLAKEAEAVHRDRNEVIREVCAAAGIDLKECSIDPAKRTVTRKEPGK